MGEREVKSRRNGVLKEYGTTRQNAGQVAELWQDGSPLWLLRDTG